LLPACDSVVVTGAHRLPDAAQRASGSEVTLFRLRLALQLFLHSSDTGAGIWQDIAPLLSNEDRVTWKTVWFDPETRFQKFLQKAGRQAAKKRPAGDSRVRYAGSFEQAFGAEPAPVIEALRANEAFLERNLEAVGGVPAQDLHRVLARLRAFRTDFEALCEAEDATRVNSFEDVTNPHKAALRATPLEMTAFGERLREFFGAGLFLSPALLTGGPDEGVAFERSLGLEGAETEGAALRSLRAQSSAPAPAPRFLMAPFAPGFSAVEPAETFARFLMEAAQPFAETGVCVFFPSQSALRTVHHALKSLLPAGTPCCAQHVEGNRDAVIRLYASTRGGWVLTTEGIPGLKDCEGKGPALLLVTRMPLPPAHDPVLEARGERLKAEGRNVRYELWNPAAIVRLKREWAGLTKRAGTGPRALWLLDARAANEGLGAQAAKALGAEPETCRNLEELSAATQAALKLF
jgi:Rad3-related DNA helicase